MRELNSLSNWKVLTKNNGVWSYNLLHTLALSTDVEEEEDVADVAVSILI